MLYDFWRWLRGKPILLVHATSEMDITQLKRYFIVLVYSGDAPIIISQ